MTTTDTPQAESPDAEALAAAVTMAYRKLQADVDALLDALADRAALAHVEYVAARDRISAAPSAMARSQVRNQAAALRLVWQSADMASVMANGMLGRAM